MDSEVFIPIESGVLDQAEILADMEAKQRGFKPGSVQWQRAVHKYLKERYDHSSIAHRENPSTPMIPDAVYNQFQELFGDKGILNSKLGGRMPGKRPKANRPIKGQTRTVHHTEYYQHEMLIRKCLTTLINEFMVLRYDAGARNKNGKPSAYKLRKGSTKEQTKETLENRYRRYAFAAILGSFVNMAFSFTREQIDKILLEAQGTINAKMRSLPSKERKESRQILEFTQFVKETVARGAKIQAPRKLSLQDINDERLEPKYDEPESVA